MLKSRQIKINMNMKIQLVELKKEILKLESNLKSLEYEEERKISDYYESVKGRGVTIGGAAPHINGIRRVYKFKKMEVSEELNKANYHYKTLEAESTKSELSQTNHPKSIHLVTPSVGVTDPIFLVLDERFETPIRFKEKNSKGEDSAAKRLHSLAYFVDVLGKKVVYDERIADNINNGLFKKSAVRKYMNDNKLEKPTLVQRSNDILVLKNDILVQTLVVNQVLPQYRSQYTDKTK